MSVLSLLIILLFIIFAFVSFLELWERIETNYPKDLHPASNIFLKTMLLLTFSPILITAGWLLAVGIVMKG
jgi:c-di-AMP phosphodiesterase-like protein